MANIKLIIQRTFNGIDVVFGKELAERPEIREILIDERNIAQIAHRSDCYSLLYYKSFTVYSYINSNITDVASREGIITFRLFVEADKKILDVKNVFVRISEKFERYIKEGNITNQNYDDILDSIKIGDYNQDIIVGNILQNSYYEYFSESVSLDDIFGKDENKLVKKLYFFNKEKAQGESVAKDFGLKPISEFKNSIRMVKVENHHYLEQILVNDKPLNYKNLTEFTILCTQNDVITYKDRNSKKAQSFAGDVLQVTKPQPTYPNRPHRPHSNNSSKTPVLNYLMIGLLGLLLGGIGGYLGSDFFKEKGKLENISNQNIPKKLKPEKGPTKTPANTPTKTTKPAVVEKKVEKPKVKNKVEKSPATPKIQQKKENSPKSEKAKTQDKNDKTIIKSKV